MLEWERAKPFAGAKLDKARVTRPLPLPPAHRESLTLPALRPLPLPPAHRESLTLPALRPLPLPPAHSCCHLAILLARPSCQTFLAPPRADDPEHVHQS
jgi:hypothetical protein